MRWIVGIHARRPYGIINPPLAAATSSLEKALREKQIREKVRQRDVYMEVRQSEEIIEVRREGEEDDNTKNKDWGSFECMLKSIRLSFHVFDISE